VPTILTYAQLFSVHWRVEARTTIAPAGTVPVPPEQPVNDDPDLPVYVTV